MVDEMTEDNGGQMENELSDVGQEAVEQPVEEALVENSADAPEESEDIETAENDPVAETESAEPVNETVESHEDEPESETESDVANQEVAEEAESEMVEAPLAEAEIIDEIQEVQADAAEPLAEMVDDIPETSSDEEDQKETVMEAAQEAVAVEELPSDELPTDIQPPAPSEPDDGRAWYVLHCYSGYENKVRHNLEQRIDSMGMKDRIFDVVVPTEEEIEVKEGKRRTVERRVFPGYILVNMVLSEESWYVVRNTPGVTSFVGQGNEPLPLRPEEVSQIIKRMEADAPRIKVTFKQGERVRIVDGPFNDFRGTVDEIDMERAKVRVMVNFFGRETPVELDFLQVEKA